MKNFLFVFLGFLFLTSCKEKQKDDSLVRQAIGNSLNEVDAISSTIKREFNKGMRHAPDRKVYEESQRFKSWRDKYFKNKSNANLLAYSDSIAYPFKKWFVMEESWDVKTDRHEALFLKQLNEKKQLVQNSDDPFVQQELLFWTLETERYLQSNLSAKVGSDCRFGPPVDLFLNGEKFKLGDTVYATFEVSPHILKGLSYKADSLFVTKLDTKENIAKTIIQSGPYFIIQILPKQKGTYMITGKMRFYSKLFKRNKIYIDFDKKPFKVY